jgi:hypothetical protein
MTQGTRSMKLELQLQELAALVQLVLALELSVHPHQADQARGL